MDGAPFNSQDFERLLKYPRTPHLEGSRLQAGDDGSDQIRYSALKGAHIVVEEKFDGANSGLSFNDGGTLLLQSRGHYLSGGGRERQFNLYKRWAESHQDALLERLGDRYVVYGEWMHKLHSVPYDALPHFWLEFDILDRTQPPGKNFLSTRRRRELLDGLPVLNVPVLHDGPAPDKLRDLVEMVKPSLGKSPAWRSNFEAQARKDGVPLEKAWAMAFKHDSSEGLYIKVENDDHVIARLKWVCPDFVQAIVEGGKHHSDQPYIANVLQPGVDIFAPQLTHTWPT